MKISKKQLKRIIKEEKAKLLNEATMGFSGTGFGTQSKKTMRKSASFWGGAEPVSDVLKRKTNKPVNESITDMTNYENAFDNAAAMIAGMFETDMLALYDEEPEAFARPGPDGGMTRDSKEDWEEQVVYAAQEIETGVAEAIRRAVEEIEMMLHDGQYDRR